MNGKKIKRLLMGLGIIGIVGIGSWLFYSLTTKGEKLDKQEEKVSVLDETMDEFKGNDFKVIGESESMQLLLQPDNGTIRWKSLKDGTYRDTKLFESQQNSMYADFVINYYSGSANNLYSKTTSMDTYSMGVEVDGVHYQKIENGIRIIYELGDDSLSHKNFPKYITKERMQEMVLQYLTPAEIEKLEKSYYTLTMSGIYSRRGSDEYPLKNLALAELYNLFYEKGKYTYEDLLLEMEEHQVSEEELPSNFSIVLPVDFYLEDGDLMVKVEAGNIEESGKYPIASIEFLPYFLSTEEKDGYMLIPDRSGALINLDNTKLNESSFSARYYGNDKLVNADIYSSSDVYMPLPVFGLKMEDSSIFGIIEQGAEVATLSAYISGSYHNEPVNRMSLNFMIREQQKINSNATGSSGSGFFMYETTEDAYKEDVVVRYHYLPKEQSDYVSMANYYASYLEKKGVLTAEEAPDNAPFYMELLGLTEATREFAGIPYNGSQALTTFDEAKEILEDVSSKGIENVKVIYSGMINNGLNQNAITKVGISSALGGKKGFNTFKEYASEVGAELFPNVKLQTASTMKGLSDNQIAYFITDEKATLKKFDPVEHKVDKKVLYPQYIISPNYIKEYVEKFTKAYASLDMKTLASDDFMTFVLNTYKKGAHVSQTNSMSQMTDTLNQVTNQYRTMLSNPIVLAWGKTSNITDLDTDSSSLRIYDASIPFVQMVLDGYITYSSKSLNVDSLDLQDELLKAIETRSALKFTFMNAEQEELDKTNQDDLFMVNYGIWKDSIGDYYKQYNEFYQVVKDANIIGHEIVSQNTDARIVTWSNGVTILLNYGNEQTRILNNTVEPHSYIVITK